jgi:hypothetical protein
MRHGDYTFGPRIEIQVHVQAPSKNPTIVWLAVAILLFAGGSIGYFLYARYTRKGTRS